MLQTERKESCCHIEHDPSLLTAPLSPGAAAAPLGVALVVKFPNEAMSLCSRGTSSLWPSP